jgi:hypothetical protein
MSAHPTHRRFLRGPAPLLAALVLALSAAGCATDLVPSIPAGPGDTVSPPSTGPLSPTSAPTPTPTPTRAPTPTPSPSPTVTPAPIQPVTDGPAIVGVGVAHCPGPVKKVKAGGTASSSSRNWSGYAITTAKSVVTCVEAEWIQPKVKCHGSGHTSVSIWVGLGGLNQGRLEQIGTASDCVGGSSLDYSWHESLPRELREIDTPVSVDTGDRIWAQVRWLSGSTYQLSLANVTTEDGFTVKDVNKGLRRTEAEWIAEAPSACDPRCKVLLMPDWGKVTFDHIGATVAGLRTTLLAPQAIRVRLRITNNAGTTTRAVVTSTASNGSSFTVAWRHA